MKLTCIKCNKELKSCFDDAVQPLGGTAFRTYGHYGSTVFDPMDGSYLDIVVCDECLSSRPDCTYKGKNTNYQTYLEKL